MRLYCKEKAALSLRKHCEYAKNPAFGKEDLLPKAGFACSGPAKGRHGKKSVLKGGSKNKKRVPEQNKQPGRGQQNPNQQASDSLLGQKVFCTAV